MDYFFCVTMSISGIYALTTQKTNEIISTDIVDIKIQNYKLEDNNEETEYGTEIKKVMPGEKNSIIPKILNLAISLNEQEKCCQVIALRIT